MIKDLRRKFILVNMALVSLVLLIVFSVLMGSNYHRLKSECLMSLHSALSWSESTDTVRIEIAMIAAPAVPAVPAEEREGHRGNRIPSAMTPIMLPIFTVTVTGGTVTEVNDGGRVDVSSEVAQQAAAAALEDGGTEGIVSSLRFLREDRADGTTRIAFADRTWENESLFALLRTSLLVGLLALACFFLISLLLSTLALRPAERAWRQQKQFVADASHELKTPLTVILANAGILLSQPGNGLEGQRKWLEYIQAEAQRMKGLVEDLLFLAKSDDGRSALQFQPVSLSDTTWESLLPFESVAFEAGVTLDSDVAPQLELWGNPDQLRRLIAILLDNAVKYAGPDGAISLALRRQGDEAVLSVRNTGEPIAPEHLPHLFERFYRTDSGRARTQGGYGLGLSIAQSIAQAHRGKISVVSSAGAGTTFTVRLPLSPPSGGSRHAGGQ